MIKKMSHRSVASIDVPIYKSTPTLAVSSRHQKRGMTEWVNFWKKGLLDPLPPEPIPSGLVRFSTSPHIQVCSCFYRWDGHPGIASCLDRHSQPPGNRSLLKPLSKISLLSNGIHRFKCTPWPWSGLARWIFALRQRRIHFMRNVKWQISIALRWLNYKI